MERVVQLMDEVDELLVFAAEAWVPSLRRMPASILLIVSVTTVCVLL